MMGPFRRLFAREPAARGVRVALFGKHPGWDDHIDDQGVETEGLVETRRLLYAEGIGGNIDSGAWQRLGEHARLPEFGHAFLWDRGKSVVVGRMWGSSDGRGRSAYPLVACAEAPAGTAAWAGERLLPILDGLEAACRATRDAARVVEGVAVAQRQAAVLAPPEPRDGVAPGATQRLAARSGMGEEEMARVLYHIERESPSLLRGRNDRVRGEPDPAHARVPAAGERAESLSAWWGFLREHVRPNVPCLVVRADGRGWADLVIGSPTPASLFCLRATEAGLPLTTEVPYEVSTSARERVMRPQIR